MIVISMILKPSFKILFVCSSQYGITIFKAVLIPYAVNLALDEDVDSAIRQNLILYLRKNAENLSANLVRGAYPEMYCNYYWGSIFTGNIASMGAQASGASLLEGVLRLNTALGNN